MSWIANYDLKWYHLLCINLLKCGPLPKHIAFIMDGNRRYASRVHVAAAEGHRKGFEKLTEVLQWCWQLDVRELTVYAFSSMNFRRSPQEVDMLMQLAAEKFERLIHEEAKLHEHGVRIRVIGNLASIREPVRSLIARAVEMTRANRRWIINIAFAYTSREEVADALRFIADGARCAQIHEDDVSGRLISKCLQSESSPPPDMLVRTSGEVRFSDFMLWQAWNTNVIFDDAYWPDFSIWNFFACIFRYQRHHADQQRVAARLRFDEEHPDRQREDGDRIETFLRSVEQRRLNELKQFAASSAC